MAPATERSSQGRGVKRRRGEEDDRGGAGRAPPKPGAGKAGKAGRARAGSPRPRGKLAPFPKRVEDVKKYAPLDFFRYYVAQMAHKHVGERAKLHPCVRDFAYPPVDISQELNMKFVQHFVMKRASRGDPTMAFVLQGCFWAPDQPFSFREALPQLLKGIASYRKTNFRALKAGKTNAHFNNLQRVLQRRYVRGIDPALIKSGKRSGNVYGMGDKGLYNAEHQTSVMPGKTHPEGLRWKLEHWPLWLEDGVLQQVKSWPSATNYKAIRELLESRYARQLPEGVRSEIFVGRGSKRRVVDLFGGDEEFALSVLSQALLFRDILHPADPALRVLKQRHGLGAGTFTVRGYWLAYQRGHALPAFDSASFCPGFVGAEHGAAAVRLPEFTGVRLEGNGKVIAWDRWETQVRFAAWMFALRDRMSEAERLDPQFRKLMGRAGFPSPWHFSELEATLCFLSRLVTMFSVPKGSMKWLNAAKAVGENMPRSKLMALFKPLP